MNLKTLKSTTDQILDGLQETKPIEGAINWSDLHCVCAECIVDDGGYVRYRVEIEEASPDETALQVWVAKALCDLLGVDVEVVTEW